MVSSGWLRGLALAAVGTLLLGACTGDGKPKPNPPTPRRGGTAVFGAEQWPACLNPITSCSSASWGHYAVFQHVLPRAMQFDSGGNVVASPLLVEAPTLDNGGLTQNPFTVRFKINPSAVWDDASPITSADFEFTWRSILHTTGVYEGEDYEGILQVDATDPQTAVLRFREPYADWPSLFGGSAGYVLKKGAFPDVDPEEPDLRKELQTEIPFSGGPFKLTYWDNDRAVLVRNSRFFGARPLLDMVTMIPITDQANEVRALLAAEVAAIFPSVSEPGLLAQFSGPNVRAVGSDGLAFEALWFSHEISPLDDPAVREALMYAVDRQAILDKLIKPNNRNAAVLNCGFVAFSRFGPWCRTRPFERFTYDPGRARLILESAGMDCSGTFCLRNGAPLEIEYWAYSTNSRRRAIQSMVVEQAKQAGFALKPRTYENTLFSPSPDTLPIADYAAPNYGDPSVTEQFGCDQIPTDENHYQGYDWTHWCNQEADRLMHESDRELDPQRRLALMERIYQLQAQDFVSLPLYVLPVVSAWRTDKIAGPIGRYSSTPYGMFFNMNEWFVPGPAQT
jgi:peptide/nickel transport system substrate-binding protein